MKEKQIIERFQRLEDWQRNCNEVINKFVQLQNLNSKRLDIMEKKDLFYLEFENKIKKHFLFRLIFGIKKEKKDKIKVSPIQLDNLPERNI